MKTADQAPGGGIVLVVGVVALVLLAGLASGQTQAGPTAEDAKARASASFGKLPLYFVENRGVYPDAVRYYIQGADKTLFFADQGVTIALKGKEKSWTVKLDFVGANRDARPEGFDKQQAVISYFSGPEKDWKAGLPTFSKIVYRDLWPGIDLVYNGTVNKLKYKFVVAPGADPKQIRLQYRGAAAITATDAGALKVETPEGAFEDAPPVAWQDIDGKRVPVAMAYALGEEGVFTFDVGAYDATKLLILDPAVIVYCGYIGGHDIDEGYDTAVDGAGNVYVAGLTYRGANTFPLKIGPDLTYNGGDSDVFVAKVRSDGTALDYCGYIGGASYDVANGIAVDGAGSAYVVGWTLSSQASFPVKVGPDLTYSGLDAFIAKVNPKGTALVYCGYIGGSGGDGARDVAVDATGRAVVGGMTTSTQSTFPVAVGPDLTFNGVEDAFVARVNAQGTALDYCGYIGGSALDSCWGIAVDSAGSAYVTGQTESTEITFPVKTGPDVTYNGMKDGFVAKVDPKGTGLVFCGYVGGSSDEVGQRVVVSGSGNAIIVGGTRSDEKTFPVKAGPDVTYNGARYSSGSGDAFVAKVSVTGKGLDYCGYVGGAGNEGADGVAIDSLGNVYVAGGTGSDEKTFPVKVGPDLTHNGGNDVYVAKVNVQGTALVYCGYVGGADGEIGGCLAVDVGGNAYVSGYTRSKESSFPVRVGPDLTKNGALVQQDAFVAKIALTLLEASGAPRPGGTVNLTLTSTDDAGLTYQLGSSLGTGPIKIGSRAIGLSVDKLLEVSVQGYLPTTFVRYAGLIGSNGQATAKINLPNIVGLIGHKIHTAFVTVGPKSPHGIKSISNTYTFTITK